MNEPKVVSTAISLEPMTLKFASSKLRNKQAVVSLAVSLEPKTLEFALSELKK